jgi:cytochrome c oxidase subunit 3
MKRDFSQELSPEIREKSKKTLVYLGIFSITMMFAGFTSAYIVSMGDSFWLKKPLPIAFYVSTGVIILSSIFLELAIRSAKKNKQTVLRLMMVLVLLSGIGFVYFQFKGYATMVEEGANPINPLLVMNGRYGDYYEVKYKGDFIEIDGNDYLVKGKKMSESELKAYQKFMSQFLIVKQNKSFVVSNYGKDFVLYHNSQPLALINGKLLNPDGKEIQNVDQDRLSALAEHVRDSRGDFFVKGKPGKDFHIYYKGQELQYKNRELYKNGIKLDVSLQRKSWEAADTATSYLWIITILHLAHIVFTLVYMMKLTIASFAGKYNSENSLSLRLGAIFWHFLGLLWIYLLLFLLFIH